MLFLKLLRDLSATIWPFAAVTLIVLLGVAFFDAFYVSYQNLRSSYDLSSRRLIDEMMKLFYGFLGVMLTFGTALGAAIVFNGVIIGVLERRREMATMKTLGASELKVGLMSSIENLIVGFLGVACGLTFGYVLSRLFLSLYDNDLFPLEAAIFPRTYVAATLGILLVLLLSQLPGLRYISRSNLATATKEWSS